MANRLSDALAAVAASHATDPDRRLMARTFEILLERGRAAHPTLPVSAEVFERFLAAAIKDEPGTKLEALAIEDLLRKTADYFSVARTCARGNHVRHPAQLGPQPGLARAELVSMVRLVGSQLNVSISRLLDSR